MQGEGGEPGDHGFPVAGRGAPGPALRGNRRAPGRTGAPPCSRSSLVGGPGCSRTDPGSSSCQGPPGRHCAVVSRSGHSVRPQLRGGQDAALGVGEVGEGEGGERGVVVHATGMPAGGRGANRCYRLVDISGQPRPKVRAFDCRSDAAAEPRRVPPRPVQTAGGANSASGV